MIEFPEVPKGEPLTISASSFLAFEQCPDRASARYSGVYGPESHASFRGGLAHRLFARHLTKGPIPAESFSQVCRQEIGASSLNHKLASLGLRPSELARTIEEVAILYRRFVNFPQEGFAGAEVAVETEPAPGVTLKGSIDALFEGESGVKLVDWKTGQLASADRQLMFYALIWAIDREEIPSAVEAVSVETGERVTASPDLADLNRTAVDVAHMAAELRTAWASESDLVRRAGPWCSYCPLLEGCSEGRSAMELAGLSQTAGGSR